MILIQQICCQRSVISRKKFVHSIRLLSILQYRRNFLIKQKHANFSTLQNEMQKQKISEDKQKKRNVVYYAVGMSLLATGLTFLSVPLYRIFCQVKKYLTKRSICHTYHVIFLATSFAGTTKVATDQDKIAGMTRLDSRLIRVKFMADTYSSMQWKFKPMQDEIYVNPGETALVFYSAINPTDKPVVGISTYNITPYEAAYYFCKIQCFCFDEQMLNPGEQVDMPVFFYIDPDYVQNPNLEFIDNILLNYTFFEAKEGLKLPDPFEPPAKNTKIDTK